MGEQKRDDWQRDMEGGHTHSRAQILTGPLTLRHKPCLLGHGSAQLVAGKAAIGALESLCKIAVVARDGEGSRVGCLVHCDPHFLLGFEVDTIPGPAKPGGTEGPGGTSPAMMGGWGKPRGVGHSLYLGCPSGLTLEADFISGKDHHAPWRLSRDHRRLHHYRQGGEGHQAQFDTPEQWDGVGTKQQDPQAVWTGHRSKCGDNHNRDRKRMTGQSTPFPGSPQKQDAEKVAM